MSISFFLKVGENPWQLRLAEEVYQALQSGQPLESPFPKLIQNCCLHFTRKVFHLLQLLEHILHGKAPLQFRKLSEGLRGWMQRLDKVGVLGMPVALEQALDAEQLLLFLLALGGKADGVDGLRGVILANGDLHIY